MQFEGKEKLSFVQAEIFKRFNISTCIPLQVSEMQKKKCKLSKIIDCLISSKGECNIEISILHSPFELIKQSIILDSLHFFFYISETYKGIHVLMLNRLKISACTKLNFSFPSNCIKFSTVLLTHHFGFPDSQIEPGL